MKHKWLFNALAVLFLITGLFGGFANTSVAVAATDESNPMDKIEPTLVDKFNQEGMVDFIVRFNDQADLTAAYGMGWEARGQFVYDTLKETAATSQAQAKGMLDAAGLEYQTFIAGNDLYVKNGNLEVATALAALDAVYYIRATRTYYIDPVVVENPLASVSWSGDLLARNLNSNVGSPDALAWGISYTKADQFWTAFGVQGDGIKVANIDTGVQWNHPALDQSFACPGDPSNPACWSDPSNICGGSACDNNGHGTHTMGTMVGDDDPGLTWQAGMAPNATWIACKGCESSSCSDTALNACADWILAPGGNPANRPNVVNNSWGGGGGDNWYQAKVQAWRAAGTFPAFSAGNNGSSCNTLGSPGDYQESFGSAANDSGGNIASFSSRGPSAFGHDPYTKPNITAPGVAVCSSVPTNSWSCGYSGTSMASPHSAGAVALLWSCAPSLIGQMDATFQALQNAATTPPDGTCGAPPDGEGNYTFGYGYLDVLTAGTGICGGVELGSIDGYVFDNNSNPIEGATVSAVPALEGAGIQATTDPTGYYTMTLVVGTYDVTAFKQNYTSQTQTGVEVLSGQTTTLPDFVLTFLGAWTELPLDDTCPDWTRFDGQYFAGDGMVYLMGGRSGTDTIPDIYAFDPNTNTCTNTGTDMIVGVSNYQIVPLTIGAADVLCTFGGRDPSGGQTNVVQCYDPIANTISQESTLPASLAPFSPAAAVGVDNKAYVFGGFRSTAPPYETAETWEWDPSTDTWTQKGDLVLGMGYIQADAVGGLIYGFGGTIFDGANLVAQTIAQVFDPATGNWTSIADLPTAGAEGRAYSLAGKIVVAGGGQWPAETAEAFLYDIATDSYDYSFADLNVMRRDHAGFLVPGAPNTLWVLGGRSSAAGYGGDSPPYAPPEYYIVTEDLPAIAVDPTFLDETVIVDTPVTATLNIMNVGGGDLDWMISEMNGHPLNFASPEAYPYQEVAYWDASETAPESQLEGFGVDTWGTGASIPTGSRYRSAGTSCDGSNYYLFGGQTGAGTVLNESWEYDPASNAWTALASMPVALMNMEATCLNGMIYLVGGYTGSAHTNNFQIYDVATNSWTATTWPNARTPMTAAYGGMLYAFGGNPGPSAETWMYDPSLGTWTMMASMPTANTYGAAVTVGDYIFQVGGPAVNVVQRYDPATNSWNNAGPQLQNQRMSALTVWYGNMIYVISGGGSGGDIWTGWNTTEVYDPSLWPGGSWAYDDENIPTPVVGSAGDCAADSAWGAGGTSSATYYDINQYLDDGLMCNYGGSVDVPWLSEDPTSGQNDTAVTVTFDPTGMPVGQYFASLVIDSNDPVEPTLYVPVTMTVVDVFPVIEVDPTSLASTQAEDEIVTQPLTINNVGTADLDWMLYDNGVTLLDWSDNFDSYGTDVSLHGLGGWKGWGNDPTWTAYTRDVYSISAPNSAEIMVDSDLVHEYSGYTSGFWTYTAWQYIPTDFSGTSYFILLNQYDDAGATNNWSTQVNFDSGTALVANTGASGGTLPMIKDQWVEIRVEIDLDNNVQTFYYGGDMLYTGTWTDEVSGGGILNIGAVDLFANGASPVYYDDISLLPPPPEICDFAGDIPWLSVSPDTGTTAPGGSSPVDVTFDATGMAPGDYSDYLCASSNDPATPIVAIPVAMTVVAKEAGVSLTPDTDAMAGDPGATVVYNLTLENTGNFADSFTVEAAGVWDVNLPVTSFDLGAGETADVVVEVMVPADAMAGDMDTTTVTATSAFDPSATDSSELTTTANQVFSFELTPATAGLSGAPGDVVTYTLSLTNTGNGFDTYVVTLTMDAWEVTLPVSSFDLDAGENVEFVVLVTINSAAGDGDMDIVTITVTSDGDGSEANSVLTTTAVVVTPEGYFLQLPIVFK